MIPVFTPATPDPPEPTSSPIEKPTSVPHDSRLDRRVQQFVAASISPNTRRAYDNDIAHFRAWGGSIPAPPETIARYLADHAEKLSMATLARRLAGIGRAHALSGHPNPAADNLVRITLRGIRRTYGRRQKQVAALTKEQLIAITASLGAAAKDIRDRALLLIGFAGAFRRSELISLNCSSIDRRPGGIVVTIPRSKTDQEGRSRAIAIPRLGGSICPVGALDHWLEFSGITEGPLFRPVTRGGQVIPRQLSGEAVAVIVKERAGSLALESERYSGHSLRAGFVTSAAMAGVPIWKIKAQTGHASEPVLARYIRNGEPFAAHPISTLL